MQSKENIYILSMVHKAVAITSGHKVNPETVTYYNRTKVVVDALEEELSGAINAAILFKKCTNERTSQKNIM